MVNINGQIASEIEILNIFPMSTQKCYKYKDQLINMVMSLTQTASKMQDDYKAIINLSLYNLERNVNMMGPYSRRNSLNISGIPTTVKDD